MTSLSARRAATAIARRSLQSTRADPRARGADWRTATVATVNAGGTIVTSDGITARVLSSYRTPTVGDLVAITTSGAGSWLCWGPTSSGGSTWTPYTPTWTATSTNPVLGNGVLTGAYTLDGDSCHVHINMVMGSTTSYGVGQFRWALPYTAAALATAALGWTGSSLAGDTGNAYYPGVCRVLSSASVVMGINPLTSTGSAASEWNSGRPFTWGSGDYLDLDITYQTT